MDRVRVAPQRARLRGQKRPAVVGPYVWVGRIATIEYGAALLNELAVNVVPDTPRIVCGRMRRMMNWEY